MRCGLNTGLEAWDVIQVLALTPVAMVKRLTLSTLVPTSLKWGEHLLSPLNGLSEDYLAGVCPVV